MNINDYSIKIVDELRHVLSQLDSISCEKLVDIISSSKKIFVAGAGRSGLMVKSFAMRLMHMGFDSYVVGETTTPNIESGDLLVIASGSGETGSLVSMAQKAKQYGSLLALVSIFPESSIGKLADIKIKINTPTPKVKTNVAPKSIQPMGSLFEQSLLIFFDAIILLLMEKQGKTSDTMFGKHANLE